MVELRHELGLADIGQRFIGFPLRDGLAADAQLLRYGLLRKPLFLSGMKKAVS